MPQKNTAKLLYKAQTCYKKGKHHEVVRLLDRKCHQIKGDDKKCLAYLTLGRAYFHLQEKIKAYKACYKATQVMPGFDYAWYELGNQLSELRCYEQALECYVKALDLNPDDDRYYLNSALMLRELGCDKEALGYYDAVIMRNPNVTNYYRNKVSCLSCGRIESPEHDFLMNTIQSPYSTGEDRMYAHFALAKIYHDSKEYAQAQEYALIGNQLRSKIYPFHLDYLNNRTEQIIESFKSIHASNFKGHDSCRPVFIIGLSRSGKSLIESLMAKHPQVHAKHECCFMGDLISNYSKNHGFKLFYSKGFNQLLSAGLGAFAQQYLSLLEFGVDDNKAFITDTTPQNIEHLGLLKLMFPNAKFILCHRNLKDNYLKIFFKYYVSGNSYSHRIQDIHCYQYQMKRLCQFWENELDIQLHHVNYESLVQNTQQIMQGVFSSCHLSMPQGVPEQLGTTEIGISKHYSELFEAVSLEDYTSDSFKATGS